MKVEVVESYMCSSCRRVYFDRKMAERCCICPTCGRPTTNGLLECVDCQRRHYDLSTEKRWLKATKVNWWEYEGECVWCESLEHYFYDWDWDFMREEWAESQLDEGYNPPDERMFDYESMQVFGTYRQPLGLDSDECLQTVYDLVPEDWEWDKAAEADLEELCRKWNAKHGTHVYMPDYSVALVGGRR